MKKSVCQIFNKNCLETGLKPDIPAINAAALEYVKRFPLFNVPSVAFSDRDFDETIAAGSTRWRFLFLPARFTICCAAD